MNLFDGATGNIAAKDVQAEIQVTTQLQEILRDLTHPFYKVRRLGVPTDIHAERWKYDSSHFRASYLGHTLHLVEAMIVQLRDDAERSTKLCAQENATPQPANTPPEGKE